MAVYLTQVEEVEPVLVGLMGFVVFQCGFLAPVVRRTLGPRNALPVVASLLTVVWLAEKFVSSPPADLSLSIIGTILFLWCLPLLFESVRTEGGNRSAVYGVIALLLGISAETAVKGAFGTVDLSWAHGAGAYIAAVVLAAAQGFFVWRFVSANNRQQFQEHASNDGWPYLAIGPALALQFLLFQNVAHQTVYIGWPQPAVFAWVLAANLAGVAAAIELTRQGRGLPWPVLLLLSGLLIAIVADDRSGLAEAVAMLIGQVLMAVLLVSIVRPVPESSEEHLRRGVFVLDWRRYVGLPVPAVHLLRDLPDRCVDTTGSVSHSGRVADWPGGGPGQPDRAGRRRIGDQVCLHRRAGPAGTSVSPAGQVEGRDTVARRRTSRSGNDLQHSPGIRRARTPRVGTTGQSHRGRGPGRRRVAGGVEGLGSQRLCRCVGLAFAASRNGLCVGARQSIRCGAMRS